MRPIGEIVCFLVVLTSCYSQWLGFAPLEDTSELEEPDPWVALMKPELPNTLVLSNPLDYDQPELEEPVQDPTTSSTLENLAEKVDNLMSQLKSQEDKIAKLEGVNKKLIDKVDIIEQQVKTNNLIFYNVTENKRENHRSTLQKVLFILNRVMKVRASPSDITVALRADVADDNNTFYKHRVIVVKFANFATRMKVLGARSRLSHSNIWVSPDYSEQVSKTRSQLLPFLIDARIQGHSAFLLYDKLVVDGIKKTLVELQAEVEERTKLVVEAINKQFEPEPEMDEGTEVEEEVVARLPENPDDQVEEVYVDPEFQDNEYEDE
ncbi:hypothetical protein J6590_108254 [Homalodisca vitripennis]|nr:hypothetical protein J6590_108254 [Homalodisca vitripennis]